MSKDKAEEKAKAYAGITPDVNNVDQLPNQFVFVKTKYFSFVAGYAQAVTDLSTENAQLMKALREILESFNSDLSGLTRGKWEDLMNRREDSLNRAKQLLTDNTK